MHMTLYETWSDNFPCSINNLSMFPNILIHLKSGAHSDELPIFYSNATVLYDWEVSLPFNNLIASNRNRIYLWMNYN